MIEFKNVTYAYDDSEIPALNNINLAIKDHEWISILGHNGSGKSTLAKLLIGLLECSDGQIYIDGKCLNSNNLDVLKKVRKNIGIVFQNPDNQFVGYNVKYDIAFGLENHQIPRSDMLNLIDEFSKRVGMENELEREPQTLSGGQKQRVAIAGILALNCETIIFDEATSMLDPEGTREIINLICELKEKYNKTIITITHDLSLANRSDRIVVLKDGNIIKDGTPEEVFKDRDILKSSNLDMPFGLRFYHEASSKDSLKKDSKLMEAIWEYHLKK